MEPSTWDSNIFGRTATSTRYRLTAFGVLGRELLQTAPLFGREAAEWYQYLTAFPPVVHVIIERRDTRHVEEYIPLSALPDHGEPTPTPELPEGADEVERHYRLTHDDARLPLPTGDAVRRRHRRLLSEGRRPTANSWNPAARDGLLQVTLTHRVRTVNVSELPSPPRPHR
jgi:hypothetical protein